MLLLLLVLQQLLWMRRWRRRRRRERLLRLLRRARERRRRLRRMRIEKFVNLGVGNLGVLLSQSAECTYRFLTSARALRVACGRQNANLCVNDPGHLR